MPLPVFKSAEEIPEAFRSEYEEVEGEWRPKTETELASEKRKRAKLLDEKRDADRKAKEAADRLAAAEREREGRDAGVSEEAIKRFQKEQEERDAKHAAELADRDAKIRKLTLTDRVQALYLAHGGMSDRIEDAMLVLDRRSDLGDEGGIVWKDKDGAVTADTPEAFFGKLKKEKPWLFSGTGSSGSGAPGSDGTNRRGADAPTVTPDAKEQKRQQVAGAF